VPIYPIRRHNAIIRSGVSKTTFVETKHTEDGLKQIVWGAISEVSGKEDKRTEPSNSQTMKKKYFPVDMLSTPLKTRFSCRILVNVRTTAI
jgi:hypothetical protein